jgi:SAM-dependent methyltransferase
MRDLGAHAASRPCGCSAAGIPIWREAGHTGLRCACGLVYLDPPATEPAASFEGHFDGYYAHPAELRLDWITQFCPTGRLLEVGPGAGHLLAAARLRGFEIAGVDPNPVSAERIRARLGIDIDQATIETSALPDRAFDVIVHIDLLSHFDDPVAALRAMVRRLRPGGHLCFEVGLTGGISPLWYRALGRVDFPAHRWLYSRLALERVVARAGLAIVGTRRFGLVPACALLVAKRAAGRRANQLAGNPRAARDHVPSQTTAHRLYDRAMYVLRYRIGRFTPDLGPQTLFVAARPT